MDDEAVLIARRVAMAAAAWFNAPTDVEAYRRLADGVGEWNAYCSPALDAESGPELLDELGDVNAPQPIGALLPGLAEALRRGARNQLSP